MLHREGWNQWTDINDRNGRAVGVEYTTDATSSQGASEELAIVKAKKLIVVSAGALGSPTILERSGIGARSVLEKNNIRVLVDLPGVGENYQGRSDMSRSSRFRRHVSSYRPRRCFPGVLCIGRNRNDG